MSENKTDDPTAKPLGALQGAYVAAYFTRARKAAFLIDQDLADRIDKIKPGNLSFDGARLLGKLADELELGVVERAEHLLEELEFVHDSRPENPSVPSAAS